MIAVHAYEPDPAVGPDHRGDRPCLHCPLPHRNRVHEVPDRGEEQAEHLRRIGDTQ